MDSHFSTCRLGNLSSLEYLPETTVNGLASIYIILSSNSYFCRFALGFYIPDE